MLGMQVNGTQLDGLPAVTPLGERQAALEQLEAYRRGLSEPPLLLRWHGEAGLPPPDAAANPGEAANAANGAGNAAAIANAAPDGGPALFVLSTDDVDRHGDVVAADGWNLVFYRRNPVLLWAHDYRRPAIGRALNLWAEPHRLLARMEFAPTAVL